MTTEHEVLMQAFWNLEATQIELAARIDGIEILAASLGVHVGIDAHEFAEKLRITQATAHQKRLQTVEDRNPAASACVDSRSEFPPIDEEMLRRMDIGTPPSDPTA